MTRENGAMADIEQWGGTSYVSDHLIADQGEAKVREVLIDQVKANLPEGYVMLPDSGHVELVRRDDPRWMWDDESWPEGAVKAFTTIRCYRQNVCPKGGEHRWFAEEGSSGVPYRYCDKCGHIEDDA
jgi:hypothetical protein